MKIGLSCSKKVKGFGMKLVVRIIGLLLCSIFLFNQAPLHSMQGLKSGLGSLQGSMNTLKGNLQKISGSLGELQKKLEELEPDENREVLITLVKGSFDGQYFKNDENENAAIVNAANTGMRGGGGIDGYIHDGFPLLWEEENISNVGCPTGEAKLMMWHKNKNTQQNIRIINAVGPSVEDEKELRNVYQNTLKCADARKLVAGDNLKKMSDGELNAKFEDAITHALIKKAESTPIKTIVFPCISTALFHYNIYKATPVAINAVLDYLKASPHSPIEEVRFMTYAQDGTGLKYVHKENKSLIDEDTYTKLKDVEKNKYEKQFDYDVYVAELPKPEYGLADVALPVPDYLTKSSSTNEPKPPLCCKYSLAEAMITERLKKGKIPVSVLHKSKNTRWYVYNWYHHTDSKVNYSNPVDWDDFGLKSTTAFTIKNYKKITIPSGSELFICNVDCKKQPVGSDEGTFDKKWHLLSSVSAKDTIVKAAAESARPKKWGVL